MVIECGGVWAKKGLKSIIIFRLLFIFMAKISEIYFQRRFVLLKFSQCFGIFLFFYFNTEHKTMPISDWITMLKGIVYGIGNCSSIEQIFHV